MKIPPVFMDVTSVTQRQTCSIPSGDSALSLKIEYYASNPFIAIDLASSVVDKGVALLGGANRRYRCKASRDRFATPHDPMLGIAGLCGILCVCALIIEKLSLAPKLKTGVISPG